MFSDFPRGWGAWLNTLLILMVNVWIFLQSYHVTYTNRVRSVWDRCMWTWNSQATWMHVNARVRIKIDLKRVWPSEIDRNKCQHFLKANLDWPTYSVDSPRNIVMLLRCIEWPLDNIPQHIPESSSEKSGIENFMIFVKCLYHGWGFYIFIIFGTTWLDFLAVKVNGSDVKPGICRNSTWF